MGLALGVLGFGPKLYTYTIHHPYFALEEIEIQSGPRLNPKQVQTLGGIEQGRSLWTLSPGTLVDRLRAHPWISEVRVKRKFPRRLEITVVERTPVAILAADSLSYVDPTGRVLPRLKNQDDRDLPYITGLPSPPKREEALQQALALLNLIQRSRWPDQVSEVHRNQLGGWSIFLNHKRITILLPQAGWQDSIPRLAAVLRHWLQQGGPPALMDARFAGQVVVRPGLRQGKERQEGKTKGQNI